MVGNVYYLVQTRFNKNGFNNLIQSCPLIVPNPCSLVFPNVPFHGQLSPALSVVWPASGPISAESGSRTSVVEAVETFGPKPFANNPRQGGSSRPRQNPTQEGLLRGRMRKDEEKVNKQTNEAVKKKKIKREKNRRPMCLQKSENKI